MKEIAQHAGELRVQQLRHVPQHVTGTIGDVVETEVEGYTEHFLASMPFLVLACCGSSETPPLGCAFPQQSILCASRAANSPPLVQVLSEKELVIHGTLHPEDPLLSALDTVGVILAPPTGIGGVCVFDARSDIRLKFAALAIDMRNRRRVKLNGRLVAVRRVPPPASRAEGNDSGASNQRCACEIKIVVEECMGNCPKYIVAREFRWTQDSGAFDGDCTESVGLTAEAMDILANSTTAFLATVHTNQQHPDENDLGVNHRGGLAGFLRHARDADRGVDVVFLPDYSGNRFYQSLGNIETNPSVSLAVCDFVHRRMMVVQGRAKNLFAAEATSVMPQVSLVTQIDVDRCVVLRRAVPFQLVGDETPSPYSPPVRRLTGELLDQRHEQRLTAGMLVATLVSGEEVAPGVARLVLELTGDGAVDASMFDAGTHIILNCAAWAPPLQYRHMDDRCPQRINDDYTRTWTVTSWTAADSDGSGNGGRVTLVELVVRQKARGAVTPGLVSAVRDSRIPRIDVRMPVLGVGNTILGDLRAALMHTLTSAERASQACVPRLVFVLGGIGCTLLLSCLHSWSRKLDHGKRKEEREIVLQHMQVTVLFSRKACDATLDTVLQNRLASAGLSVPHELLAFESPDRRIAKGDIDKIKDVHQSTFVLCGPPLFCSTIRQWLCDAGAPSSQVIVEKFDF